MLMVTDLLMAALGTEEVTSRMLDCCMILSNQWEFCDTFCVSGFLSSWDIPSTFWDSIGHIWRARAKSRQRYMEAKVTFVTIDNWLHPWLSQLWGYFPSLLPFLVGNTHWSSPSVEWLNFIQHTSNKRNAESPATDWTLSSDYVWAQTELSSSVRRWFDNLTWPRGGRRRGGSLGASGGSSRTRNFLFSTTSPTPAMTEGTISSAGGISRVNLEHSSDFV